MLGGKGIAKWGDKMGGGWGIIKWARWWKKRRVGKIIIKAITVLRKIRAYGRID